MLHVCDICITFAGVIHVLSGSNLDDTWLKWTYQFLCHQLIIIILSANHRQFSSVVSVRAWVAVENELMSCQRQTDQRSPVLLHSIGVLVSNTGDTLHLTTRTNLFSSKHIFLHFLYLFEFYATRRLRASKNSAIR